MQSYIILNPTVLSLVCPWRGKTTNYDQELRIMYSTSPFCVQTDQNSVNNKLSPARIVNLSSAGFAWGRHKVIGLAPHSVASSPGWNFSLVPSPDTLGRKGHRHVPPCAHDWWLGLIRYSASARQHMGAKEQKVRGPAGKV